MAGLHGLLVENDEGWLVHDDLGVSAEGEDDEPVEGEDDEDEELKKKIRRQMIISHWRSDIESDRRPGEPVGSHHARLDDYSVLERNFLFDSVGWSIFSHDLTDVADLPFNGVSTADKFRLAVLEGKIEIVKKPEGTGNFGWTAVMAP